MDDTELERLPPSPTTSQEPKPQPDFAQVHRGLKANRSVTLQLLGQEFAEQHPGGPQYSWFCQQYREWARHLDVVLRQDHRAGEKLFIDHAGDTVAVVDPAAGESRPAYVFVAVLGAGNYTFAEATWTRSLPDWIGSHTRALASSARPPTGRARPVEGWREPALLLGTGAETFLSGLGHPLRRRGGARAPGKARKLPESRAALFDKLDRPAWLQNQ